MSGMIRLTGAQALVRLLAAEKVGYAFGVAGGKLAPLLHAISQQHSIRYVGVRHEAAGPMMAAAIYAGSGQMAIALGEMGPGGLNLASGVGVAHGNNLPLLAITSNQHRAAAYPHVGMFMDLDTLAVLAPLTKWNAVVHDGRRLPELVRRAFREALGGRPGPVHLDIPQDVLSGPCEFADDEFDLEPSRYRAVQGPRPAATLVSQAVAILRAAKRPLIVAGGGVVASGAAGAVRSLAGLLNAPVVPTQMALGVVASNSPHFVGHGGIIAGAAVKAVFEQADVILNIGCRYSSWMWDEHGPLARRQHRLININIDPSALGAPVLHEVAMLADASLALADLLSELQSESRSASQSTSQSASQSERPDSAGLACETDWLKRMREIRAQYDAGLLAMATQTQTQTETDNSSMHPAALAYAVAKALPADTLAVYDGGHTTFWSNDFTPVNEVRTRFHDPGMSHLGFGLPYALALKLMHPRRCVVNITGDGSFGFTVQELDTARRNGLAVVTIIHNNESWGIIRSGQRKQLDFELGTSLAGTDYAAIARGFGCFGEQVTHAEGLAPALARGLESGLPVVLDCRTRFVPHPATPMFGSMNRYGFEALTAINKESV
jgi:thiamine pyrophosphate-dependent acetolactate synthase large subunit-like protein